MKKLNILFFLILTFQISHAEIPVFAQDDNTVEDIKNIIQQVLDASANRDLNAILKHFSISHSIDNNGDAINYNNLETKAEKTMNSAWNRYLDLSFNDLQIVNSDIKDDKATVVVQYNQKEFNLDTLKEEELTKKRRVILIKEDSTWKIIQWMPLEQPNE